MKQEFTKAWQRKQGEKRVTDRFFIMNFDRDATLVWYV